MVASALSVSDQACPRTRLASRSIASQSTSHVCWALIPDTRQAPHKCCGVPHSLYTCVSGGCVCVSEGIWGDVFIVIIYWNILVQWEFICKQQWELIIMNWCCFFSLLKWLPFDFKMTVKAIYPFYLYISPKFRHERPRQGGVGDLQHPQLKSDTVTVS